MDLVIEDCRYGSMKKRSVGNTHAGEHVLIILGNARAYFPPLEMRRPRPPATNMLSVSHDSKHCLLSIHALPFPTSASGFFEVPADAGQDEQNPRKETAPRTPSRSHLVYISQSECTNIATNVESLRIDSERRHIQMFHRAQVHPRQVIVSDNTWSG